MVSEKFSKSLLKQPTVGVSWCLWVKDPALSLLWLRSRLWCRFDPWPWNFHMLQMWPKKIHIGKKRKKKKPLVFSSYTTVRDRSIEELQNRPDCKVWLQPHLDFREFLKGTLENIPLVHKDYKCQALPVLTGQCNAQQNSR